MNDNTPPQACPWLDRLFLFVAGGDGAWSCLVQGQAEIRAAVEDAVYSKKPAPGSADEAEVDSIMEGIRNPDEWCRPTGCAHWSLTFEDGSISLQHIGLRPGDEHSAEDRVAQLLAANNREVERRRAAEGWLDEAKVIIADRGERVTELEALINDPQIAEFFAAAKVEAAHQVERHGREHDEGKSPEDWVWVLAHLVTKAAQARRHGDNVKYLHHLVTAGAALARWHALAVTAIGAGLAGAAGDDDGSGAGALS